MTFKIRNLKRSASGQESIREASVTTPSLLIGRAPNADIRLETLDVVLRHAVLRRAESGSLYLDVTARETIRVDGRIKRGKVGPLVAGQTVTVGIYELRFDEVDGSHATITVEEMTSKKQAVSNISEENIFSLKRALPSKRLMSWAFIVSVLGIFLFLPVWSHQEPESQLVASIPFDVDASWNSGPISLMHSNLKNNCEACHTDAWETVSDETCEDCHAAVGNHAAPAQLIQTRRAPDTEFQAKLEDISEAFGRPVDRCSSCHVEHNSRAYIIPTSDETCADCHRDLNTRLPDTALLNVADFGNNHPQFRPTIITQPSYSEPVTKTVSLDLDPKGFSGLKFPHKTHMDVTGGVARMARALDARYDFSDGVGCEDCHKQEAGGALYEPVRMEQDCAMCHSIVFEDDEGYQRTLRHGEPEEVIASMRDFYEAKALGNIRDTEMNSRTRRRPGRAARIRELNRRELAFKQSEERTRDKVYAIFSEGGSCYDCHVIDRPIDAASLDFRVRPISVSDAFYDQSPFNHAAHEIEGLACKSCHAAETSMTSDDILLPKIEVCRDCHIGQASYALGGKETEGTFPTTCLTCHGYHNDKHVPYSATTLSTVSGETASAGGATP